MALWRYDVTCRQVNYHGLRICFNFIKQVNSLLLRLISASLRLFSASIHFGNLKIARYSLHPQNEYLLKNSPQIISNQIPNAINNHKPDTFYSSQGFADNLSTPLGSMLTQDNEEKIRAILLNVASCQPHNAFEHLMAMVEALLVST